jgi:hypothetical protein
LTDVKAQISEYLDFLRMKYTYKDGIFELLFSERKDERPAAPGRTTEEGYFRYTIWIKPSEKWVEVYCDVYPLANIPAEKKTAVLLDLLACNRKYSEVCFDYEESRGMIGTSQEMMAQGLNFDEFREEFLAVPWAVKKFWSEIAKKHGLK